MYRIVRLILVTVSGLGLVALFMLALPAAAARDASPETNIVVDTLEDELNSDGDCSLREAITAANDNIPVDACPTGDGVLTDTISFSVAGTIALTEQLSVTAGGPLVIDGGEDITVSGNNNVRVFWVDIGAAVFLQNIGVEDGKVWWEIEFAFGGGIQNSGEVFVVNSRLRGNDAQGGGGIYNSVTGRFELKDSSIIDNWAEDLFGGWGGGIANSGRMTVTNSTFIGNWASGDWWDGDTGGAISNDGILKLVSSTLKENHSAEGGAIRNWGVLAITSTGFLSNTSSHGSGGIHNSGILTVSHSTFDGNRTSQSGGGGILNSGVVSVFNSTFSHNIVGTWSGSSGGGIHNVGVMTVTNSTIHGNQAISGDWHEATGGGIFNSGTLLMTNDTVSNNAAGDYSGGIHNEGSLNAVNLTIISNTAVYTGGGVYNTNAFTLSNSIIAANTSEDCDGTITSLGHNIAGDDSCALSGPGDMNNTDPLVGHLQDNGGDTWTHGLLWGSPAIDAGDNAVFPPTDQRGVPRPLDGDGDGVAICDIGSYEFERNVYLYPSYQTGSDAPSTTITYTITLLNETGINDTFGLALGEHAWETTLLPDTIGPLPSGESQPFTVSVTISPTATLYMTDTVIVSATSVTSPTIYSASAQVTTQAYAPPQISIEPPSLESVQYANQIVTQTLTISNGNGVTLTFSTNTYAGIITDVVLLLHLDEPEGATTFYDASGNGNHGTCSWDTCPITGVPGKAAKAVDFDGINDFIQLPSFTMGNAVSIGAWVYSHDIHASYARIIDFANGPGSDNILITWDGNSGRMKFDIWRGGSTAYLITDEVFPENEWVHVVAVVDENGMGYIYWNGVLVESAQIHTPYVMARDNQYIARSAWWFDDYFNGLIDELVVFDRALSAEEVFALFSGGAYGSVDWLSVGPVTGTVPTKSSFPIQVTFDATELQPEVYTSSLFIESNDSLNSLIKVPVTMTVLEPGAPLSVAIEGVAQGLAGYAYPLTATVSPISATLPFEYVWQADGQAVITHTSGISDVVSYVWDLAGTYQVQVSATNFGGTVTDAHSITIADEAISGLSATNDGPTMLGSPTTLSATLTSGTNVSYIWDFGDETSGTGQVATHTYGEAGIYSAVVTATNSVSTMTATTIVTIMEPMESLYLPLIIQGVGGMDEVGPHGSPGQDASPVLLLASAVGFGWWFRRGRQGW